ncbi:DUF1799 domain-containing protein [Massilia sp. IC2-278]|uniref:DUF1799 domain-containing protein n=1 Tax=Massilia sp. IC2-278 TaxID=2887200 RepID=UPI001E44F937|nr:DUF1799 domain-containing protein [Massilia sp. IC2-278]
MLHRLRQGLGGPGKKLEQVARCAALGLIVDDSQQESDASTVDEAAAAFGLIPVYDEEQIWPLYLWPENVMAWAFFSAISTQWVVGPGGVVGLNYAGVHVVREAWQIKRKEWPSLFSAVQVMERATLAAWREKNNK